MFAGYLAIVLHISLGSYEDHVCFHVAYLSDLVDPGLNVSVTRWIRYRVGEYYAMCSFIERFGDVSEALLTCSVPNVESDLTATGLYSLDFEVYPDGAQIVGLEGIFAVPDQQTCLPHATVSDDQVLQSYILLRAHY